MYFSKVIADKVIMRKEKNFSDLPGRAFIEVVNIEKPFH